MTNRRKIIGQPYSGCVGVLAPRLAGRLSISEIATLRSDADATLQKIGNREAREEMLASLVYAAEVLRGGRERDEERKPDQKRLN